jgi:hypothetical protein
MMPHVYDQLVSLLQSASAEAQRLGLGPSLAKGRVGEVLLAHTLGHQLVLGDKGADGVDGGGLQYEYKVSDDDQYNYFFGKWRAPAEIDAYINTKFNGYAGSYCAKLDGGAVAAIVYIPIADLTKTLIQHLKGVKSGSSLQKNHSGIDSVAALPGAIWIKKP